MIITIVIIIIMTCLTFTIILAQGGSSLPILGWNISQAEI